MQSSGKWKKYPGSAIRIAVGPSGPWVVNKFGNIYEYKNLKWNKKPGCAKDIGVGSTGKVWVIGCDLGPEGYGIYNWNGSSTWFKSTGGATNISVNGNGNPFVTNANGYVYWDTNLKLNKFPTIGSSSEI